MNFETNNLTNTPIYAKIYRVIFMFFETNDIPFNIASIFESEYSSKYKAPYDRPYHALSYRIIGDMNFNTDEQNVHINSGDITFVPAYCKYNQVAGHEHYICIHFSPESPMPDIIKKFTSKNPQYFENLFKELVTVWKRKYIGYNHECKSIIYKIFTAIEKEYRSETNSDIYNDISNSVKYIHEHFTDKELTIGTLSKMCAMSETYYRKLFHKSYGVSPVKYINNLKTNYATELLRSGDYTVEEVSDKCGFSTASYFSAYIKRETGKNPSELKG